MKKYFLLFVIFIGCNKIYSIESDFMLRANFIHKWIIDRPPIILYGLGYSAKIADHFQTDLSVYFFNKHWNWEGEMGFTGTPDTNIYHGTANGTYGD